MINSPSDGRNPNRPLISLGAILAVIAVALGAFGAHALKGRLSVEALEWWGTAVQYQMWHAVAVLAIGLSGVARLRLSAILLASGALVFSGSLYAMALGAPRWFGAITPLGGVLMVAGWVVLAWRGRAA